MPAPPDRSAGQPPLPPIPTRDLLLRLSFTQQAATFLHLAQHAHDTSPASAAPDRKGKGKMVESSSEEVESQQEGGKLRSRRREHDGPAGSLSRLARSLASDIPRVASHNKIRIDPNFKRSLCRSCNSVLLPGLTSRVKSQSSSTHVHVLTATCNHCSASKTLPRPALFEADRTSQETLYSHKTLYPTPSRHRKKAKGFRRSSLVAAAHGSTSSAPALPAPPDDTFRARRNVASHLDDPELTYSRRETSVLRALSQRAKLTSAARSAKMKLKDGRRRPGDAEAGYGTGGGLELLSERHGVGHWRTSEEGGKWEEV